MHVANFFPVQVVLFMLNLQTNIYVNVDTFFCKMLRPGTQLDSEQKASCQFHAMTRLHTVSVYTVFCVMTCVASHCALTCNTRRWLYAYTHACFNWTSYNVSYTGLCSPLMLWWSWSSMWDFARQFVRIRVYTALMKSKLMLDITPCILYQNVSVCISVPWRWPL
jgi:hypothetical protein